MSDNTSSLPDWTVPEWAVPNDEALDLIPKSGFIRNYMTYMQKCTDAPLIYHYGVATTILSCACSGADILCRDVEEGGKRHYVIPTPIWSALIGVSGAARKSSSMNSGIHMLTRAKSLSQRDALLPGDGSLEGWHDFMVENNEVLLYRDELAVMFDQAKRGYSEGLKHWLMEMYSGHTKTRSTVKDQKSEEKGKGKTIERPRLAILGGIPPDTFTEKSSTTDWRSGFLARFTFWPGEREWFKRRPGGDPATETLLAQWLAKVACKVTGYVEVPPNCREDLTDWFMEHVESHRRTLAPDFYSHLVRYQDLGLRLAAMHAVARAPSPKNIIANDEDVQCAFKALTLLKASSEHLFKNSQKDAEKSGEDEIIAFLQKAKKPKTLNEISERLSISRATLHRRLKVLQEGGEIRKKKGYSEAVGPKPWLYSA